ncbi:MAG: class IV adenylate cyclase [Candidatus Absconditabacterales bacterium]
MKKVEVKAKVADVETLKDRLVLLGFFFSQALFQQDRLYLPNDTLFSEIKEGTVILRLRNSNGRQTLKLKKIGETFLDTIEREIVIDDPDQAAEMLKYIGYYQVLDMARVRQKSSYNGLTISLDQVEELGSFIKVEKMVEDEDIQQVQDKLFAFLERFGISKEDQVTQQYGTLIYQGRHS